MYIRELLEPSLINRVLILNYQFNKMELVLRSTTELYELLFKNALEF